MNNIIRIKYDTTMNTPEISFSGICMDTSAVSGKDISEWEYPFIINNIRWDGLYDELKKFCKSDSFSILFDGTTENMNCLKEIFKPHNINVFGMNNNVIIIYKADTLITRITVNGRIFDTSKLNGISIDEWCKPFRNENIEWNGIFDELTDFIGTCSYSVQFVGKIEDMKFLMDACSGNINITYKNPVKPATKPSVPVNNSETAETSNDTSVNVNKPPVNLEKDYKNKLIKFFFTSIAELKDINQNKTSLSIFGKISYVLIVAGCIVSAVFMRRLLMLLMFIPAIIFAVMAYKEKYKNAAIITIIAIVLFGAIGWIICTIRWNIALNQAAKEMEEAFGDLNDIFEGVNDAMDGMNDVFGN